MTELLKKLKLTETSSLVVLNNFENYEFDCNVTTKLPKSKVDNIIVFTVSKDDFIKNVKNLIIDDTLNVDGKLFVAYSKKDNKKIDTFISRDDLHELLEMDSERYAYSTSYKFNQLISLNDVFSIMILKKVNKEKTKKIDTSFRVSQYESFVPLLEEKLEKESEALNFYTKLTKGYKVSWARYIYSAKQESTQEKRLKETIELLKQGVKTKN